MYFLFVLLVMLIVIFISVGIWSNNSAAGNEKKLAINNQHGIISDIIMTDCYLQRLLMIEILTSTEKDAAESENVTFEKLSQGIKLFGDIMIKKFGGATAQRITTLISQRNKIIRDYYKSIKNADINLVSQIPEDNLFIAKLVPDNGDNSSLDSNFVTMRKLQALTKEIIELISMSKLEKNHVECYEKLYNIICMYDKELIGQAKTYSSKQYEISFNCGQSSLKIAQYIAKEIIYIITDKCDGDIKCLNFEQSN